MKIDANNELLKWLETQQTVCFDLPIEVDWQTGEAANRSVERVVGSIIEPMFAASGELRVIGGEFSSESFQGQGAIALELSEGEKSSFSIRYRPGVTSELFYFLTNPTQGRGVFEELRGTLVFQFEPENETADSAMRSISSPHIVKNFGKLFGAGAKNQIREAIKSHPTKVIAAFSDRSSLRTVHFFGHSAVLKKVISCSDGRRAHVGSAVARS